MSFAATHRVGFGAGGAEAATANISMTGAYENGAPGSSTVTFSSCAVGTAASDRYIIVCVGMQAALGVSSITVGGAATTYVIDQGGSFRTSIYITSSAFTTGTTADIVVNVNTITPSNCAIAVFAAYGLSSTTATHTLGTNTDAATMALNTANPGVAVGIAGSLDNSSFTVSGLTETADSQIGSDTATFAAGCVETTGSTVNVVFDSAAGSPTSYGACCASFPR